MPSTLNRRALLASTGAVALVGWGLAAYSPADRWMMERLGLYYSDAAPMDRGLAMAIWGRVDAHGRDRSNKSLYPLEILGASSRLADWQKPCLPRSPAQLRAECERAQPYGGWWPEILRMLPA